MAEYKQPKNVALPAPGEIPKRRGKIYGSVNLAPNKLAGYPESDVKTSGVETRGNGAATKGTKARGPLA